MKKKNSSKSFVVAGVSLFLSVTAVFGYIHFNHHQTEKAEAEFAVTTPWHQNLEIKKEYVAQIRAIQHIELRSLEKGYLQNIFVDSR